jgi:hypothetical protein
MGERKGCGKRLLENEVDLYMKMKNVLRLARLRDCSPRYNIYHVMTRHFFT